MMEFGSDFHYVNILSKPDYYMFDGRMFFACGRQALLFILIGNNYKRVWLPEYYCYEVVDYLRKHGIEIMFYLDSPLLRSQDILINDIEYREGDALVRINYFGLRGLVSSINSKIPIIEDHSHDLLGEWTSCSDADWCFASLRKTLPLAEGGVLWSPKGNILKNMPDICIENEKLAQDRWRAMGLKSKYLRQGGDKSAYRELYIETEKRFSRLPISMIDGHSTWYIKNLDIKKWYCKKKANWEILYNEVSPKIQVLLPESLDSCFPFALVLCFENLFERDRAKKRLIDSSVYPAVLWEVPEYQSCTIKDVSSRLLAIHCDARYDNHDITNLLERLRRIIR